MTLHDLLLAPFLDYAFMRRAAVGAIVLSLSACPVGVFLMLRRMSLTGDAMSHAILPGVGVGFLVAGLDLLPMTLGGLVAGLVVAVGSGLVSRLTAQKEDAALAAFYLLSLAAGVLLVSSRGTTVDLMHVLFGSVLALDDDALHLIAGVAIITSFGLALIWRPLFAECLDPLFLRSVGGAGSAAHIAFLVLVVLNLVGGFQALGTLLSVGLMVLPAAAARFWALRVETIAALAVLVGVVSSLAGLLVSYHAGLPSGPAIILVAGLFYLASMALAPHGFRQQRIRRRHRTA